MIMKVLSVLAQNLMHGTVTFRFPQRPPTAPAYRGLVLMDAGKCQGCGMCAFVCTSRAIVFRARPQTYEWSYDGGQCTFCGRCVDACASAAISMEAGRPPVYTVRGALKKELSLPRKPPPGTPAPKPAPAASGGEETP